MKYIGFDLGASSGKMMLAELKDNKIQMDILHRFPNRQSLLHGCLYWDIVNIFNNLLEGLSKAAFRENASLSLGIDAYCNDYGLIGRNGQLINQVFCYRDERTTRNADAIYAKVSKKELYMETACQIAPFNTAMQMAAMVCEGDGYLLDHCDKALFIPDLLTYLLSGEKITEYTLGSVSQLMNYRNDTWHENIMKRLGIRPDIFPDVTPCETIVGKVCCELNPTLPGLDAQIVTVGGHDTASAVAALPSVTGHAAYISSGTWSLVGTEVSKPILNEKSFKYNICYEGGMDHQYRMTKNVMGLWIFQECCFDYERRTNQKYDFDYINAQTANAKSLCCFIDPDEAAFFYPGDMINKVQNYCRMTGQYVPETFGEVLNCVLESLAMAYRYSLELMEDIVGYRFDAIHILGGGGQNDILNQAVANACQKAIHVGPYEAALTGNIMMQMKASGEIKDSKEGRGIIRNSFPIKVFEPKNSAAWEDGYETFQKITNKQ